MSSKASRALQDQITQFCGITGASTADARRYLEKYKRLDQAVDMYYTNPPPAPTKSAGPSTTKITQIFERYKAADEAPADPSADMITFEGTTLFCEELGITPDDIVVLALAYELKSPRMGEWPRKQWIDGWKSLGIDSVEALKGRLPAMRDQVRTDPAYFAKIYQHAFDFARAEGQRSLPMESAKAFWEMLIPVGIEGGALSHIASEEDDDDDAKMTPADEEGWNENLTKLWFDFLDERGGKGISKDTWSMFREFVRTIDSKFEKYDVDAAWPSQIDDFVEYVKEHSSG